MLKIFLAVLIISFFISAKLPRILNSPLLKQFRVLFPSWRFFESLTPIPKVYYRISRDGVSFLNWQEFQFNEGPRQWYHLFYNPMANLRLTYRVQIEQFLNDVAELDCYSENFHKSLISYQIVSTFLKQELQLRYRQDLKFYQFKIGVLEFSEHALSARPHWTESLVSPEYEV